MSDQQEMTVESLRQLSSKYNVNADRAQRVAQFLRDQKGSMYWQSEAATSFKNSLQEYIEMLTRFNQHFSELSKEVKARADIIEESQRNPVR
ncbi:MAG TPA: hypothetical protein VGE45_20705 [Chloroflexia bacterium]|jgi:uncharacterized protein YukE